MNQSMIVKQCSLAKIRSCDYVATCSEL